MALLEQVRRDAAKKEEEDFAAALAASQAGGGGAMGDEDAMLQAALAASQAGSGVSMEGGNDDDNQLAAAIAESLQRHGDPDEDRGRGSAGSPGDRGGGGNTRMQE